MKPCILDLFCGAGGAAMGYHNAGFDLVGVDIEPQPNYPFTFIEYDAIAFLEEFGSLLHRRWDAIHASPPCQAYSVATKWRGDPSSHPDLLEPTRDLLEEIGLPWVIENVPGAPMTPDVVLCGSMFDLQVRRHRLFLSNVPIFDLMPSCRHRGLLAFEHKQERAYACLLYTSDAADE